MTSPDTTQRSATAQPGAPSEAARDAAALESHVSSELAVLRLLVSGGPDTSHPFDRKWHADYLDALNRLVAKAFGSDSLVAPLRDIAAHVSEEPGAAGAEPLGPQEVGFVHAFAAAEISYLVFTGTDEAAAAQKTTRRLIRENVPLPQDGGDPRGWVRLLKWREILKRRRRPAELFRSYESRLEDLKQWHRNP